MITLVMHQSFAASSKFVLVKQLQYMLHQLKKLHSPKNMDINKIRCCDARMRANGIVYLTVLPADVI